MKSGFMSSKQVWKKCTFCNNGRRTCFKCGGSGKVSPGWQTCYDCKGMGTGLCTECGGNGGRRETIWSPE